MTAPIEAIPIERIPTKVSYMDEDLRKLGDTTSRILETQARHTTYHKEHRGTLNRMHLDVQVIRGKGTDHEIRLANLGDDVAELKNDVAQLKTDMTEVKNDVADLRTDVAELRTDMIGVKSDVSELKTDMAEVKTDMAEVKGTLAVILSRLPAN